MYAYYKHQHSTMDFKRFRNYNIYFNNDHP